jgi:hypothetical protein
MASHWCLQHAAATDERHPCLVTSKTLHRRRLLMWPREPIKQPLRKTIRSTDLAQVSQHLFVLSESHSTSAVFSLLILLKQPDLLSRCTCCAFFSRFSPGLPALYPFQAIVPHSPFLHLIQNILSRRFIPPRHLMKPALLVRTRPSKTFKNTLLTPSQSTLPKKMLERRL